MLAPEVAERLVELAKRMRARGERINVKQSEGEAKALDEMAPTELVAMAREQA